MKENLVLKKLRKDEVVSVVNIGAYPCASLVEMVGKVGFDCIWFDMEHRAFGLPELSQMTLACRATGMEAMVRVVKGNYTSLMKPLETGATGLMIPHCRCAEEAKEIVSWAKFPPQGRRGFDNAGPDADYLMSDPVEYTRHANQETFLVVQIEDKEVIDSIDEIASVEGINVLFIGPGDLSLSYGVFPDFNHEKIENAINKVAEATQKYGKWWGMPFGSEEQGRSLVKKGARFLSCGSDITVVLEGFQEKREVFSHLQEIHFKRDS